MNIPVKKVVAPRLLSRADLKARQIRRGRRLQDVRRMRGFGSPAALAREAGLSQRAVWTLEKGLTGGKLGTWLSVAMALKVTPDVLLDFSRALRLPTSDASGRVEPTSVAANIDALFVERGSSIASASAKANIADNSFTRTLRLLRGGSDEVPIGTLDRIVYASRLSWKDIFSMGARRRARIQKVSTQDRRGLRDNEVQLARLLRGAGSLASKARANVELLERFEPDAAAITKRALGLVSGEGRWSVRALAREYRLSANQVGLKLRFGVAVLMNPQLLEWYEAADSLHERVRSYLTGEPLDEWLHTNLEWRWKRARRVSSQIRRGHALDVSAVLVADIALRLGVDLNRLVINHGSEDPPIRWRDGIQKNIRNLRAAKGLDDIEFRRRIGDMHAVWKNKGRANTRLRMALRLAWALQTDPASVILGPILGGNVFEELRKRC